MLALRLADDHFSLDFIIPTNSRNKRDLGSRHKYFFYFFPLFYDFVIIRIKFFKLSQEKNIQG